MPFSRTVIISCAGMGNRLGLGATKALVNVDGKPLIIRHLEMLQDEEDVRVIVGFQAEKVIDVVTNYRKDILFVFNHKYKETGTGASLCLGAQYANDYILSLDGDLIIHPDDMKQILECKTEFVGGGTIETEEPWMVQTQMINNTLCVTGFSQESGAFEWNGVTQIKTERLSHGSGHVYQLLEPHLPLPYRNIRTREIDTIGDYEKAVSWVKKGFQ